MSNSIKFPDWIAEAVEKNHDQLNPKSREFLEQLFELFPHLDRAFLSIPATTDLAILKSFEPKEVQDHFGLESPHEFILLNVCELLHFQTAYQLRELGLSLISALTEGRFYVSAVISRTMFEVVCVNYYTFHRVEKQFKQCLDLLKIAAKTKSKIERTRRLSDYYQGAYKIFSMVFDANTASSISWPDYLQRKFNVTVTAAEEVKKVHVHTAIEDLGKQSKLPLMDAYVALSEFVHPNVGSKMLLVNTKRPHHLLMDALTIGDNKANPEAALFYFDHVSESMFYTWTLALTLFHRGQKLLAVIDSLIPKMESKSIH